MPALTREDRQEAFDRGARAMALHMADGRPAPRSPWCAAARRTWHFRQGAAAMERALRAVLKEGP